MDQMGVNKKMVEEPKKPEEKKEEFKGEIEITDMREFLTHPRPGIVETQVHITYRTPEGATGTITIPKKEMSEERIKEELKKAVRPEFKLVGKKLSI